MAETKPPAAAAATIAGETPRLPASLWADIAIPAPPTGALAGELDVDVAIVGAGFAGLSAALELSGRGARVALIEAAEPGWGASGRNNGQVVPGLKLDPDEIETVCGAEHGARLVQWAGEAPDVVFDLIEKHRIRCQPTTNGWIEMAYTQHAVARIEARCAQWAARGAPVAMVPRERLASMLGTPAYIAGWSDHRGGTIDPLSYVRGLAGAAIAGGARIFSGTPALELSLASGKWSVRTPLGRLKADKVVVATGAYADEIVPGLRRSIVPTRIAQIASAPLDDRQLSTILPCRQAASDTRRLLTSFRISPDGRLMIAGAWATGSVQDASLLPRLHRVARELFGHLGPLRWEYGWSGYFPVTSDRLPHVHESNDGVICALGCNGRGIAVSTAMGRLVAERILGKAEQDMALAPTPMPRVAFHEFRRAGIAAATRFKSLQDRWDRMNTPAGKDEP